MSDPFKETDALVLREVKYKEADRILSLFTVSDGLVTAKAQGALRKSSALAAGTQQLTYSTVLLFENRDKFLVKEAVVKEAFSGLRSHFENLALGCYFAEAVEALVQENVREPETLQLILNSLYALSNEMHKPEIIKAAFELRLMCILGYTPDTSSCCVCGKAEPDSPMLGIENGHILCRNCRTAVPGGVVQLCSSSLAAMRYISKAPAKQLFSFEIGDDALRRLCFAAETYILHQADRRFSTLDYYKSVAIN